MPESSSPLDKEAFHPQIHVFTTSKLHTLAYGTLGTGKDSGRAQRLNPQAPDYLDHLCIMVLRNARTALRATFHTSGSGGESSALLILGASSLVATANTRALLVRNRR